MSDLELEDADLAVVPVKLKEAKTLESANKVLLDQGL